VLNLRPVNLGDVLEAALDTVRPAANAKGITLAPMLEVAPPGFWADADRLQQVVWNLLFNAIKFSSRDARVELHLRTVGDEVEVVVQDEGPGIDADLLPHIFERFRQGDASSTRSHGGLGLGLAIVRHLVELHGGTVQAANRTGSRGAVFTVRLPREGAQAAGRTREAVGEGTAGQDAAPSLRGLKVLVVDDEDDARELVILALESCGARTVTASSAAEALTVLAAERPDVLLSDIAMPEEDGWELLRRVRALPADQGGLIPAVALTAYASEGDRRTALRSGFQGHLAKPAHPADLVATVARLAAREPCQAQ
jgi:CheY-like chemotaxis protein